MSDMIEMSCKFILCVLLTQLGKTFQTINRITTEIEQDDELGRSVHIVFTMNTLLNNRQFAKRLQTIEQTYGKGSISIFTSKYDGPYVDAHVTSRVELQGLFIDEDTSPRVVVACNNFRRYDDVFEFIHILDKIKNKNIHRVFLYYDELHQYISESLRTQIETIHGLDIVKSIMAMTASPNNILLSTGFWSSLPIIQLDNFNEANYVGFQDMIFNCMDDYFPKPYVRPWAFDYDRMDFETLGFIEHVLTQFPEILSNNHRSFIPAHKRRNGHNAVRDLVFSYNPLAVVCVINGFEKTLQYKQSGHTKTLLLSSGQTDEEVCETISRLIHSNQLSDRPLVITGLLCVGMGQTLTHKSLGSFHSAIFGHLDLTNDDIYQLFGRTTGRMKDWGDKYVQTQIYCPTIVMHRCRIMEECARAIARDHNGDVITLEEYQRPMRELDEDGSVIDNIRVRKSGRKTNPRPKTNKSDFEFRVFDLIQEAIDFGKEMGFSLRHRKTNNDKYLAPKTFLDKCDGQNPTVEYICERQWGLNKNNNCRMIPTKDDKWCVYWRPSMLASDSA